MPKPQLDIVAKKMEPQLVEIRLRNNGNADALVPNILDVRWKNSRLIASDALRDFDFVDSTPEKAQFRRRQFLPPLILRPNDECFVGWLRFTQETEVRCEFLPK